jgi:hypothetical protein
MKSGAMTHEASHSAQSSLVESNVTDPITVDRTEWIASRAYFKSVGRGFELGHEVDDWLEAETEYAQKIGQ